MKRFFKLLFTKITPIAAVACTLAPIAGFADVIILGNTPGANGMGAQNTAVPSNWASNTGGAIDQSNPVFAMTSNSQGTWGTPNIGLTWSATGGSNANRWEFHGWSGATTANSGGGVLQMDGTQVNSVFSIGFTPDPGHRVILNGFNFVGDTNNGHTYQYTVEVINLLNSSAVFTTTTNPWITATSQNPGTNGTWANAPGINLGVTGDFDTAYRLDVRRIAPLGGTTGGAVDMAIDNLSIGQQAIPEPTAALLFGSFLLGAVLKRRRSASV